jgi:hypothetical protein
MKHLKKFNETNQDNYWSLYDETKKNITLCLIYLMDQGMACKPDANNLYTIVLRIYPNGLGTYRTKNKVRFDNNIKESISWFLEVNNISISKYNYTAKVDIRLVINGKSDLRFDSSELKNIEGNDVLSLIQVRIKLTNI